jgi:hypothetical protein
MADVKSLRGGESRREHWQRVLARQRASRLSIKAFCARNSVSYQSFFLWKRKFASAVEASALAAEKVTFAPVTVLPQATGGWIEIELPSQKRVVRVHGPVDRQALADVLGVLEAGAC